MVEIFSPKLFSLISEAEKPTADFKSWKVVRNPYDGGDPNRPTLAKAMVGFANRDGGNLIIGVDDDTREAEGEPLDEERINGILAEIAATECDPNVQWDRTFYSSENGDLEQGDVYVVHIDRRRGPPHAIIHGQGRREYRIRSGDETRLVDTSELAWLFQHQSFPKYQEHVESGLLYHKNLEPLSIDLPANHNLIQQFLFKLSDKDAEFITTEFERMIDFIGVIAPFAFLHSLNIYHMNSWDVELRETKRDYNPFKSTMTPPTNERVDPNMEIPMEEVGSIEIDGSESTILSDLSLEADNLIGDARIKSPPGVEINLVLGDATEENESVNEMVYGESAIVISREDKFVFAIEFGRQKSGGVVEGSVPQWPEILALIELGDYGKPLYEPLGEVGFSVRFISNFKFPDYIDNDYDLHTRYAENLFEIVRKDWDIIRFMDSRPNPIFYEMNYKLDMLVDAFNPME